MTEILSSAQMRGIEQAEIDSGRQSGAALMARAGAGIIGALRSHWPDLAARRGQVCVLCGPGNNGGDGFVVAQLLRAEGWAVTCLWLGDPMHQSPEAFAVRQVWLDNGQHVLPLDPETVRLRKGTDLVIDALFGIGLKRPVAGLGHLAAQVAGSGARVLAVDLPTGLCADSGRILGHALRADLTVTFATPKPGHYLADGPGHCGALHVAPLGLHAPLPPDALHLIGPPPAALIEKQAGHKFDHGHALVLTGGMGRTGAARLAARAALRMGAGLVTLAAPGSAMLEVACQITSLMLARCNDSADMTRLLDDPRLTALCLGPGLGHDRALALLPDVLASGRPVVLDADALSAHQGDPDALFKRLHPACVLTPHGGEFARLFPDLAAPLHGPATTGPAPDKVQATRAAAARAGCTVLFKGPDTVIAAPDGRAWLHAASYERAAPWLATAGAGDVLAGMICGLLARGLDPRQAACAAAWLHVEAARHAGPGLLAEDLPDALPAILRACLTA